MPDKSQQIAVALFVRHPIPGRVKTRLACDLGVVEACDIYQAMVADVIASIAACGVPCYLFHDGQDAAGLPLEWVNTAEQVIPQSGDSLGGRMAAAFETLFSIGLGRVVLVGSDIPGIDVPLLRSAICSIEEHDVVISPALDGGYCLIASKRGHYNAAIFYEIPWSSSRVLEATLAACVSAGLTYALLDPRQDIDTLNDLGAYCRQPSSGAARTNRWLVSHGFMAPVLDAPMQL